MVSHPITRISIQQAPCRVEECFPRFREIITHGEVRREPFRAFVLFIEGDFCGLDFARRGISGVAVSRNSGVPFFCVCLGKGFPSGDVRFVKLRVYDYARRDPSSGKSDKKVTTHLWTYCSLDCPLLPLFTSPFVASLTVFVGSAVLQSQCMYT